MNESNKLKLAKRLQKLIRLNNIDEAILLAEKYNCILVFDDDDSNNIILLLNSNSKLFIESRDNYLERLLTLNPEKYMFWAQVDLVNIDKIVCVRSISKRLYTGPDFYRGHGIN